MRSVIVEREDGTETITIYGLGDIRTAHSDHPNFGAIKAAATSVEEPSKEDFEDLFNVAQAINRKFERLTDRISIKGNDILLDLEPVHNALAEAILSCLKAGEDFKPLVNFMERLEANPNPRSREALFTWLDNRNFTITPEGLIIGYKGVSEVCASVEGEHAGVHASSSRGHAFVDGIEYGAKGHANIPYPVGSVIEMPRSEVTNDSDYECGEGLHVGTYQYALTYARPTLLEVHIDPRDVVSVPASTNSTKIRVCRLTVVGEITEKYDTTIRHALQLDEDDDELWEDFDEDEDYYEDEDEVQEPSVQHPPLDEFHNMLQRAKRRRQAVIPYIEHMTARAGNPWRYSGSGEVTDLSNWVVCDNLG